MAKRYAKDEVPRDPITAKAIYNEITRHSQQIRNTFWQEFGNIRIQQQRRLAKEHNERERIGLILRSVDAEGQERAQALSRTISAHILASEPALPPASPQYSPRLGAESLARVKLEAPQLVEHVRNSVLPADEEDAQIASPARALDQPLKEKPKQQPPQQGKRTPLQRKQQATSKPLTPVSSNRTRESSSPKARVAEKETKGGSSERSKPPRVQQVSRKPKK